MKKNFFIVTFIGHGRKVGPSPETPGPSGPQGSQGSPRSLGAPVVVSPVPQDPMDPRNPQDLWTLGPPGTSGPQDPWDVTFTVWNSESKHTAVVLDLLYKYRDEVSHRYGSVVFLAKEEHLQVTASKFGLRIPSTKIFSLILSSLVTYFKNICLKVSLICKST